MAVLIDSDLLIAAERGDVALEHIAPGEAKAVSVVSVSELLHGVSRAQGEGRLRRLAAVEGILAALQPIPITDAIARIHAELWAQLESTGQALATHDLWIGATALRHGLGVATRNVRDFERVPSLRVVGV